MPAEPRFERAFQLDSEVLRREERGGAAWLSGAAYGILAVVALAWLAAIVAAVTRFDAARSPRRRRRLTLCRRRNRLAALAV